MPETHGVTIRAYTLMPNHIHLVAVPGTEEALSLTLHVCHTKYSKYFNAKYTFTGTAWEDRPGICVTDEAYMWKAIRYVERNPVRACMVERAEDYLWSSAAAHSGLRDDILLDKDFPPPGAIENWSEWLRIDHTEEEMRDLKRHTFRGTPWGTPEFLKQLESITGRSLGPRKPGRPKRK